jgi:hypothetical protein
MGWALLVTLGMTCKRYILFCSLCKCFDNNRDKLVDLWSTQPKRGPSPMSCHPLQRTTDISGDFGCTDPRYIIEMRALPILHGPS